MFVQGQVYKRSDLHARYGGQAQGGISTPVHHPFILLFTSETGEHYGYQDGWSDQDDGIFLYTGEGQVGDMEFVRGNAAIRDHVAYGKDLHLFAYIRKAFIRYIGQMICTGYEQRRGSDRDGNPRQVIIFELTPLSAFAFDDLRDADDLDVAQTEQLTLDILRQRALGDARLTTTAVERKVAFRQRSQWIKLYALRRAGGRCEGCGAPAPFLTLEQQPYLEVHHIERLSDGGPDAPDAVVAICPNCHRRAHHPRSAQRDAKKP